MDFKIDTKSTFTTIMPLETEISAKLTGELANKCEKLRQSGSKNFIIDLQNCLAIDKSIITELLAMHEASYSREQSLVFTGINENVMSIIKEEEADLLINIARSMVEAIDIVSMEILERDLLSEE
jgi:anti-anti-sigma regulatory factor